MIFDKILPSKKYVLITKFSIEEVYKRVAENIKSEPKTSTDEFYDISGQYKGNLTYNAFRIHQVIVGKRNSFAPLITGIMSSKNDKTFIDIKMEILPFAKIIMTLWLGVVGFVCIIILFIGLFNIKQVLQNGFKPFVFIPFGLFLFGCYLPTYGFRIESENAKRYLIKLLDGQEERV